MGRKIVRNSFGRPKGTPCKWKGQKLPWDTRQKKRRVFTIKQQKWADLYMQTGNARQAAIEAYDVDMTDEKRGNAYASSLVRLNRKSPEVMRYMNSTLQRAAKTVVFLCEHADNEAVRLRSAQDILDRLGMKPADKVEIDDKRELNGEDYEAIKRVQSILKGVKLEEIKPVAGEVVEIKEAETYVDDERETGGSIEPSR